MQPFVERSGFRDFLKLVGSREFVGGVSSVDDRGEMMKRFGPAILFCFLLSGCIFDPVFDTSNWESFQTSVGEVTAKLSNDDLRRLDIALKYLASEGMPRVEIDSQVPNRAAAAGDRANPFLIFTQLRSRINGKSAATIIKDLSIKLDAEISQAEARLQSVEGVAGSVEVSSPGYYWKRSGRLEQPAIEFAVFNAGKLPISRVYFRIALTTPNRPIPWAKQDYVQVFNGGLEPREKRQLSLQPHGEWSDPQLRYLSNAELKVTVLNFEDAIGQRMIPVDKGSLELKRKVLAALQ
jgi:uncharacterized protein DUF6694